MNPRVVPSGFLFDDIPMQKTQFVSTILSMAAVLFLVTTASGKSAEPLKSGPLGKLAVSDKKESFYFRVPHESNLPHLIEECPSIILPQPKRMKACQNYVSGAAIKALRCESLDGRFLYLVYKSKEDCLIDREATLANEE